jgi:hypothetical protein
MTVAEGQYRILGPMFTGHEVVNHTIGEYVRGKAHTNVEGAERAEKIVRGVMGKSRC